MRSYILTEPQVRGFLVPLTPTLPSGRATEPTVQFHFLRGPNSENELQGNPAIKLQLSFPLLCAEMHVCCFLFWTDLPRHFSTWNVLSDSSSCLVSLMFQNLLKQKKKKKKNLLKLCLLKESSPALLADTQQPLWNYDWRFYLGLPHHWQISIRGNPEIECKRVCVILPSCFHKSVSKSQEILKWVCDLKDWDPHFLTSASHTPNVHTNYLHFIKMKIPVQ